MRLVDTNFGYLFVIQNSPEWSQEEVQRTDAFYIVFSWVFCCHWITGYLSLRAYTGRKSTSRANSICTRSPCATRIVGGMLIVFRNTSVITLLAPCGL